MKHSDLKNATINDKKIVKKPWGRETIFAAYDGMYVGKVIEVYPGQSLSCQVHHEKTETQIVINGIAHVEYGTSLDGLEVATLYPGDTIHIPPGCIHKITAGYFPLTFVEVSTAHHGWETDITRFSDDYGRAGTADQ